MAQLLVRDQSTYLSYTGDAREDVQRVVAQLRGPTRDPVDLSGITTALEVQVLQRPLPGSLWGLTPSPGRVVINAALRGWRTGFALAHELGHVLVQRGALLPGPVVERTCDWFAHELIIPTAAAIDCPDAHSLGMLYPDTGPTAAAQLARCGWLPPLARLRDGTVICQSCGHRNHLPGCECRRFRYDTDLELRVI